MSFPPADAGKPDEGVKADGERQTERGGGSSSSSAAAEGARAGREEVRREDKSDAAGGLTALAAELTCPIW